MHAVILGQILKDADHTDLLAVTGLDYFADSALVSEESLRTFLTHDDGLAGGEFPCRALNPFKGENREHGAVNPGRGNG